MKSGAKIAIGIVALAGVVAIVLVVRKKKAAPTKTTGAEKSALAKAAAAKAVDDTDGLLGGIPASEDDFEKATAAASADAFSQLAATWGGA